MSKLSPRDTKIAKLRAQNVSCEKIGKQVGLGRSRVAVICEREDVKTVIEQEQKRLVSLVPSAIDNYKHWIGQGKITNDKDMRDIAFKASTKVLEGTGLLSNAPSVMIQNVYNDNKTIISPVIMKLLQDHQAKLTSIDDDIIEGEFKDYDEEG